MLSLIAAISENYCIGNKNQLPWNLPEDLKHFKEITAGHPVIMGRKTWESLPPKFRPLPGRVNIVITRQANFVVPAEVEVFDSVAKALLAHPTTNNFIIGGAQIYAEGLPLADTLYITHVHRVVEGDTFFPKIDPTIWKEAERIDYPEFSFVTYKK